MTATLIDRPVLRTVLPNGLTVLLRRDDSAPVAAVVTYVKAGYFDETDDVVGIAHVLEHMFFKGTPTRGPGQIAKETKASGGYLNAHTIYDHTSYYAVLPASGFAKGLEVQADAYANSVIDGAELAKELEVIIQEAKRKADSAAAVATETLYEVLHDRHRMRRWRIGREPGLRALTRADLLRFYRNFYRPSATVLCIVGDVDVDDTMRRVESLYGGLADGSVERSPGPREEGQPGFRYRECTGDVKQSQLVMGWRTVGTLHPDTPLLDLASAVLGSGRASRLYRAVRDRQLASSIAAYNYTPAEVGVFAIHAETPNETIREAARAAWAQVAALRDEGVGVLELERASRIFEAHWLRELETMEGQASHLASWEALGGWELADRYFERVMTATAPQVTDAVRRYLDPDQAGVVVYRPEKGESFATDAAVAREILEHGTVTPLAVTSPVIPDPSPVAARPLSLEREEGAVRVYRTRGDVPVLVRRKPGAPIIHLGVFARGAASIEPRDRLGITTLLTRTAVKGTERRTAEQIAEEAELLGGSIGGSATSEGLAWSISVPTRHATAALALLGDVVQHPAIPEGALDTERTVALSNLAALRDDMFRYPLRLALDAAFAGHPYGQSVLGTEATLQAIGADDVRAWHRERVLRGPSVIAIVGDVDADEVAASVAQHFAELRLEADVQIPPPVWPDHTVDRVEPRDKAQTALALMFQGPARRDESRFDAQLIAGVASGLGGRFFDELRDRQSLAYTVHAYASERELMGTFVAYIATSPEKEEVARRGLLAEFAKLREEPITDEELDRARQYALGTYQIRQQSGGAVLGELVDAWLYGAGLHELDEYEDRIRAVTPRSMLDLARRYFDETRRVEGIVRGVGKVV